MASDGLTPVPLKLIKLGVPVEAPPRSYRTGSGAKDEIPKLAMPFVRSQKMRCKSRRAVEENEQKVSLRYGGILSIRVLKMQIVRAR